MGEQLNLQNMDTQLADVMARLDRSEQRQLQTIKKLDDVATTVQTIDTGEVMIRPRGGNQFHNNNNNDKELRDLPEFTGDDAEEYMDWVRQMEKVFDYKGYDDQKAYKVAVVKLTKHAGMWFDNYKAQRDREEELRITT